MLRLQVPHSTITLLACSLKRTNSLVLYINTVQATIYSTKYFMHYRVQIMLKYLSSVEMWSPAQTKSNPWNTSMSYGVTPRLTGKGSDCPPKHHAQSKLVSTSGIQLLSISQILIWNIFTYYYRHTGKRSYFSNYLQSRPPDGYVVRGQAK